MFCLHISFYDICHDKKCFKKMGQNNYHYRLWQYKLARSSLILNHNVASGLITGNTYKDTQPYAKLHYKCSFVPAVSSNQKMANPVPHNESRNHRSVRSPNFKTYESLQQWKKETLNYILNGKQGIYFYSSKINMGGVYVSLFRSLVSSSEIGQTHQEA